MTMYVVVDHTPQGIYTVALVGMPALTAQGSSEHEALAALRQLLVQRLAQRTLVPLEVEPVVAANPWLELGDALHDNPLLDEVAAAIEADRQQIDRIAEAA